MSKAFLATLLSMGVHTTANAIFGNNVAYNNTAAPSPTPSPDDSSPGIVVPLAGLATACALLSCGVAIYQLAIRYCCKEDRAAVRVHAQELDALRGMDNLDDQPLPPEGEVFIPVAPAIIGADAAVDVQSIE